MNMYSGSTWPSMPWVGRGIIGVVNVDDIRDSVRGGWFNETPGESTQLRDPHLLHLGCVTNSLFYGEMADATKLPGQVRLGYSHLNCNSSLFERRGWFSIRLGACPAKMP